jgi:hypothetical protein
MSQIMLKHALRHLPPWLILSVRHADKILREKKLADEALVHDMPTEPDIQAVRLFWHSGWMGSSDFRNTPALEAFQTHADDAFSPAVSVA